MNNFLLKDIIDEDFTNYKKPSMFIATSKCTFKCEKEDCKVQCQNSKIVKQPTIEISIDKIIQRYINNDITHAVVIGGLEPIDQIDELLNFIKEFRKYSLDDIVIYTGYTEEEVSSFLYADNKSILEAILEMNRLPSKYIEEFPSIIIKYGRFKSTGDKKYDEILGIELASANQYAKIYN